MRFPASILPVKSLIPAFLTGAVIAACSAPVPEEVVRAAGQLPETVSFNFDVKPILSDRCFKCHGPDNNTRVENIRFDTPEGIRASRRHIARRILSDDPEVRMPPRESNLTLTALEKAVLLRWVEQGADYEPHWAFQPPVRRPAPEPLIAHAAGLAPGSGDDFGRWPQGAVDRFVLDGMRRHGLQPSPRADPETWLRRVTFTLTGLPPTVREVESFVKEVGILPSGKPIPAEARERVVDRLLASVAYGERMAVEWLDLARYADSHGYQDDGWRNMWPWRDWVIGAFNRNMPYDQFVTWQLAGDLLPDATREQILATGFNRNHLQSQEGGIVLEEYRVDYVADRTNTFGKAFLGLTVECSRCHDHKYDPMSQEEYYGLFAFFNSVNEVGNIPYAGEASPTVLLVDSLSQVRLDALKAEIGRLEALVDPQHADYDAGFEAWKEEPGDGSGQAAAPSRSGRPAAARSQQAAPGAGPMAHFTLDRLIQRGDRLDFDDAVDPEGPGYFWGDRDKLPFAIPGVSGAAGDSALVLRGDGWLDTGNQDRFKFERMDPFTLQVYVRLDSATSVGPLMGKSGGLFNGNRGYQVMINPDRTLTVGLYHVLPNDAIEVVTRDSLGIGTWHRVTFTYDGSSRASGVGVWKDGTRMETRTLVDNLRQSIQLTVDPFTGDSTNWGDPGNLRLGFTETNQPMLEHAAVDDFRVWNRALTDGEIAGTESDGGRARYVTTASPLYQERFAALTRLRAEENRILTNTPSVMVMADAAEPRPTHVLKRGAYDAPGKLVVHTTPATVLPFDPELPDNRLGLAEWLFDARHPLTARVAVNRLWQQVFGRGIVATPDNFGAQGALPTHPELLDWLAVEFRESGWDTRHMLRLMVLSETFAQQSVGDGVRDPDNRWLARGPSRRLSAEMMRDQALAASGLLVREIGGPPVKPYQPDGLWAELATRNGTRYVPDRGSKLYRRSMYTLWKRTVPPPMMITFDASERNLCAVNRQSTSTPLQALVLMNDPQFFEAARVLGERMMREGGVAASDRIAHGFRLLTGRTPREQELQALTALLAEERRAFAARPSDATALLAVGQHPRERGLNPVEAAAFAVVASTIMNFDAATTLR